MPTTFRSATLNTLVIGAIVMTAGGLSPRSAGAHALATLTGGGMRALPQPAGRTAARTAGPASARSLLTHARASAGPTCQATQVAITPDFSSAATGHVALELRLRNVSPQPCTLQGYATVILLDGARRPLLTVLHWGPGGFFNFNRPVRLVSVAPGGNAYVAVGWAHIPTPGQSCPLAPNLLLLPPGASSAVLVALVHGGVDACGGQLTVSAVEPTHFTL